MKPETRKRRMSYPVPPDATHINKASHLYYKLVGDRWYCYYGHIQTWCKSHNREVFYMRLTKL